MPKKTGAPRSATKVHLPQLEVRNLPYDETLDLFNEVLGSSIFFRGFSSQETELLAEYMTVLRVQPNDLIIRENMLVEWVSIVCTGSVSITTDEQKGKQLATLPFGEILGDISILTGQASAVTVRAGKQGCQLLALYKTQLMALHADKPSLGFKLYQMCSRAAVLKLQRTVVHSYGEEHMPEFKSAVWHKLKEETIRSIQDTTQVFGQDITEKQLKLLTDNMFISSFQKGGQILNINDTADNVLLILQGTVEARAEGSNSRSLGCKHAGEMVGEEAFLLSFSEVGMEAVRSCNVYAKSTDVKVGVLTFEALHKVTNNNPKLAWDLYRRMTASAALRIMTAAKIASVDDNSFTLEEWQLDVDKVAAVAASVTKELTGADEVLLAPPLPDAAVLKEEPQPKKGAEQRRPTVFSFKSKSPSVVKRVRSEAENFDFKQRMGLAGKTAKTPTHAGDGSGGQQAAQSGEKEEGPKGARFKEAQRVSRVFNPPLAMLSEEESDQTEEEFIVSHMATDLSVKHTVDVLCRATAHSRFWRGFNGVELVALSKQMEFCNVQAGERIVHANTEATFFMFVIEGSVRVVEDATGKVLKVQGPGSLIGTLALFLGGQRTAHVDAAEPCLLAIHQYSRITSLHYEERNSSMDSDLLQTKVIRLLAYASVVSLREDLTGMTESDRFHDILQSRGNTSLDTTTHNLFFTEMRKALKGKLEIKEEDAVLLTKHLPVVALDQQYRVLRKGQQAQVLLFLLAGELQANSDDFTSQVIYRSSPGDIIGESALMADCISSVPRTSNIYVSSGQAVVAMMTLQHLEELNLVHPQLALNLLLGTARSQIELNQRKVVALMAAKKDREGFVKRSKGRWGQALARTQSLIASTKTMAKGKRPPLGKSKASGSVEFNLLASMVEDNSRLSNFKLRDAPLMGQELEEQLELMSEEDAPTTVWSHPDTDAESDTTDSTWFTLRTRPPPKPSVLSRPSRVMPPKTQPHLAPTFTLLGRASHMVDHAASPRRRADSPISPTSPTAPPPARQSSPAPQTPAPQTPAAPATAALHDARPAPTPALSPVPEPPASPRPASPPPASLGPHAPPRPPSRGATGGPRPATPAATHAAAVRAKAERERMSVHEQRMDADLHGNAEAAAFQISTPSSPAGRESSPTTMSPRRQRGESGSPRDRQPMSVHKFFARPLGRMGGGMAGAEIEQYKDMQVVGTGRDGVRGAWSKRARTPNQSRPERRLYHQEMLSVENGANGGDVVWKAASPEELDAYLRTAGITTFNYGHAPTLDDPEAPQPPEGEESPDQSQTAPASPYRQQARRADRMTTWQPLGRAGEAAGGSLGRTASPQPARSTPIPHLSGSDHGAYHYAPTPVASPGTPGRPLSHSMDAAATPRHFPRPTSQPVYGMWGGPVPGEREGEDAHVTGHAEAQAMHSFTLARAGGAAVRGGGRPDREHLLRSAGYTASPKLQSGCMMVSDAIALRGSKPLLLDSNGNRTTATPQSKATTSPRSSSNGGMSPARGELGVYGLSGMPRLKSYPAYTAVPEGIREPRTLKEIQDNLAAQATSSMMGLKGVTGPTFKQSSPDAPSNIEYALGVVRITYSLKPSLQTHWR